ncbi:MAG: class I SAM-dependent methyltransferase [Nonlabens sp.]|jgi:SAM-dependent methyltransferase|uniref:methyltransferase n=1 Tax=Nonlabens sp. TaxID=1888209 RepID=UPI0035A639C0
MNKKDLKTENRKKSWPTKDAMEQVYELGLWGTNDSNFYSGIGSHHPAIIQPYINAVKSFLKSFENPLVVCDLGCGDFNVGKELVGHAKNYIAVDIVADLIKRNRRIFQEESLEFHCLDIAVDDLPQGDCALLRQVLQHLSNAEIQSILSKLTAYTYIILTEHVPEGDFTSNKDIISGQGTRLKKQSGLDVLAPPFSFKVKEVQQLLVVCLEDQKGIIVTSLYKVY